MRLRQSYLRIAKHAAMMAGRYAHAKQFNRHRRQLRILRTRLGRIIRDIGRKIAGQPALEEAFQWPLARATQIRSQQQRQRGWKLYSFHAPEVECIGKGKASAPYEFGVKASIVTTNARAPGGQFVLHAKALPGNPYDGHTLRAAIEDTERLTGREIERAYVDKGYRGHDAPNPHRVFISGQKRGVFGAIKRELRRRSAIEPVIGHMKAEGHLGRCYLKGTAGDAANAILTAVGHNLRLVLAWLRILLCLILAALRTRLQPSRTQIGFLTADLLLLRFWLSVPQGRLLWLPRTATQSALSDAPILTARARSGAIRNAWKLAEDDSPLEAASVGGLFHSRAFNKRALDVYRWMN